MSRRRGQLSFERLEGRAMLAFGELDSSFGGGGVVFAALGASNDGVSVVQQADRKVIAAGGTQLGTASSSDYRFTAVRYQPDGTLDTGYGEGGIATYQQSGWDFERPTAAGIQSDGKTVIAGSVILADEHGSRYTQVAVVRFDTNGRPDSTFGRAGGIAHRFGYGRWDSWSGWGSYPPSSSPACLAIQKDGKILVAGRALGEASDVGFVARLNADGSLDQSFASSGKRLVNLGNYGYLTSIACSDDGRIAVGGVFRDYPWVTGNTGDDIAVMVLKTDGSYDNSFAANDYRVDRATYRYDRVNDIAIQKDGKVVVGGVSSDGGSTVESFVVRYDTDGSRDKTFGTEGIVMTGSIAPEADGKICLTGLAIQSNGGIVATGTRTKGAATEGVLVRLGQSGKVDLAVPGSVAPLGQNLLATDISLQSDGRALVVGNQIAGSRTSLMVERVIANTAPAGVSITNQTVPENMAPGTVVGTLSTDDPDADDTFTYSLVADPNADGTGQFEIVNAQLRTKISLDYESKGNYYVRVRATDAGGLYVERVLMVTVTNVVEPPLSPTGLAGTSGNTQVSLTWTAPNNNNGGGAALTDYIVQFKTTTATSWTTFGDGSSTENSATVTGLTNGTSYVFRVAAINFAGTGDFSALSNSIMPDGSAPSVSMSSSKASLGPADTTTYTFTLSKPSTTFTASDVYPTNGTVSGFTASSSTVYTCTFTPKPEFAGTGYVVVYDNTFTDSSGHGNKSANGYLISFVTIDTVLPPAVSITASKTSLKAGDTAIYTFTLSKPSSTFTASDVYPTNGTVSGFTATSSTVSWCTFTPKAGFTGTAYVVVYDNTFTDASGNGNKSPNGYMISTLAIDTTSSSLTIISNMPNLKSGETATYTFTLSKPSTNFTASDVQVLYGTISSFTKVSSTVYKAKFTPSPKMTTTGYVRVNDGRFTDLLGNANRNPSGGGTVVSYVSIDTAHKR